jgi:hypothetical protein
MVSSEVDNAFVVSPSTSAVAVQLSGTGIILYHQADAIEPARGAVVKSCGASAVELSSVAVVSCKTVAVQLSSAAVVLSCKMVAIVASSGDLLYHLVLLKYHMANV